jgi:hypothetical protein
MAKHTRSSSQKALLESLQADIGRLTVEMREVDRKIEGKMMEMCSYPLNWLRTRPVVNEFFFWGVATRYSPGKYKVKHVCPNDKNWIRALVMSVESVRHHTHPIYSVSTSLALK